jgi:hypothetical protein
MMGRLKSEQGQLFYQFNLEDAERFSAQRYSILTLWPSDEPGLAQGAPESGFPIFTLRNH